MDFKQQYFNIWQQVWSLHKKYYAIQESDEKRWKELDQECERLDKQYENEPERKFVQSLLLAVVGELERNRDEKTTGATKEA